MNSDWREVLSVNYLNSIISYWAKLEELQKVIPYHSEKYKQIILNASSPFSPIAAHDLNPIELRLKSNTRASVQTIKQK